MEIEVYGTYARSEEGTKIPFDVMLHIGGDEAIAQDKAREFIEKISETAKHSSFKAVGFVTPKPQNPRSERGCSRKAIVLSRSKTVRIPRNDFS